MNIGIDFDGVLFDSEKMFRSFSQMYNLKHNGNEMVDPQELKAQKRYNWSGDEFKQFISENLIKIETNAPVMPCAKAVLNAISKKHKIYAITSRGWLDTKEIDVTKQRLAEEGIKFDGIIYSSINKLDECKKLKIDLMIDDLHDTIVQLANNGIKCLYYRDYILRPCNHANVKEVHNWGDIAVELVKLGIIAVDDINW